ncbi:hypothetical protein BGW80DRAFT_1285522 [Lactifluus volemus]|nr:hypothetical protein BGW80DRAFT_1285522 [Lactifluus volemus]
MPSLTCARLGFSSHSIRLTPFIPPNMINHLSIRRCLHTNSSHRPSRHAQFYSNLVPAMIPVALLGSAVYMGLQLLQTHLLHEKYLDEARARVEQLERDIDTLILERRNSPPSREGTDAVLGPRTTGGWFEWLRRG